MKPAALFLGVFLLLTGLSAQQKTASITETLLVPPVFTVGDLVELRVTLVMPEGQELRPPLTLPQQDWLLFRDVEIRKDPPFEHVTIKFIPFATGDKLLPPLALGDVTLDTLRIVTSSVLDKGSANAPASGLEAPRDQLALPHTEIILLLAFLSVVVLPLAAWRFFRPAAAFGLSLWKHLDRHRPYRRLNKETRKLHLRLAGISGPEYYTQLMLLIRTYLSGRFERDFSSLTAGEVREVLEPLLGESVEGWVDLVYKSDVVRFDSRQPSDAEKLEDLEALKAYASRAEHRTRDPEEAVRVDV